MFSLGSSISQHHATILVPCCDCTCLQGITPCKCTVLHLVTVLADTKVQAIKYGFVISLKWMLDQNMGSAVDVLGCMAFRSLAIIPAGVFSIYRHQGLPCIINVLAGRCARCSNHYICLSSPHQIICIFIAIHQKWLLALNTGSYAHSLSALAIPQVR